MADEKPEWACSYKNCTREREGWHTDEYPSSQCAAHNDADIERANERREWDYYHND